MSLHSSHFSKLPYMSPKSETLLAHLIFTTSHLMFCPLTAPHVLVKSFQLNWCCQSSVMLSLLILLYLLIFVQFFPGENDVKLAHTGHLHIVRYKRHYSACPECGGGNETHTCNLGFCPGRPPSQQQQPYQSLC